MPTPAHKSGRLNIASTTTNPSADGFESENESLPVITAQRYESSETPNRETPE